MLCNSLYVSTLLIVKICLAHLSLLHFYLKVLMLKVYLHDDGSHMCNDGFASVSATGLVSKQHCSINFGVLMIDALNMLGNVPV